MIETWNTVLKILERWAPLGDETVPNGARLIGHVPHVAPLAYLHQVYPGLTRAEIDQLEGRIGRPIPSAYGAFLEITNGAKLFADELRLYGLRRSFARDVDSSRQPYSIETTNLQERPKGSPPDAVFIGGYSDDGSNLYMRAGDPHVYRCPRREFSPILNVWDSFETMLLAEVERFSERFDKEGRLLDENIPTTPPR